MAGNYSNKLYVYKQKVSEATMSPVYPTSYPPMFEPAKFGVSKGEVIYVFFKNVTEQESPTAEFAFEDAEEGETYSNPIKIDFTAPSIVYTFPADIPYEQPVWYSLELPVGILDCTSLTDFSVSLYSASEPNVAIKEGGWNPDYQGFKGVYISEAGTYLLAVTGTFGGEVEATISVREPAAGETIEKAVKVDTLVSPIVAEIPTVTSGEYWLEFNVNPGTLNVIASSAMDYITGTLYDYDGTSLSQLAEIGFGEVNGNFLCGLFDYEISKKGTCMLRITYNNADATLVFSGSAVEVRKDINVNVEVVGGQSYTFTAANYRDCTFSISLPENWKVEAVTLNGEAEEVAESYTFSANDEDLNYVFDVIYDGDIAFVDSSTGMVSIDSKIKIGVKEGKIHVEGATAGDTVTVYTVGGMIISTYDAQCDNFDIVLARGTYVVRVNDSVAKVIL